MRERTAGPQGYIFVADNDHGEPARRIHSRYRVEKHFTEASEVRTGESSRITSGTVLVGAG